MEEKTKTHEKKNINFKKVSTNRILDFKLKTKILY